jgi:hypothetical protein
MARRKKARKKTKRKNPKRVAAGRKAARVRWGKGKKKASKKASKRRTTKHGPVTQLLHRPVKSLLAAKARIEQAIQDKEWKGMIRGIGKGRRKKTRHKALPPNRHEGDRTTLVSFSPDTMRDFEPATLRYHNPKSHRSGPKRRVSQKVLDNLARGRAIRRFNLAQRG